MEKKQYVDQKLKEFFQEIQKVEPPDEIWHSIEQQLKGSPRHLRRWRIKMAVASIGIGLLGVISLVPSVQAVVRNMAMAIGGFGNVIHPFIAHKLSRGFWETADGRKIKIDYNHASGSTPQFISLDDAKRTADFPLYVLPPEKGSLVSILQSKFPNGVWLNFIFQTPYGPVWVNERKYTTDDSISWSRETTLVAGKYTGYFQNGFLVWRAQRTWISMTFLSPPQLNKGKEIKADLKQVADELQKISNS
ncbi:MAG: hypothetical protein K6T83_16540 [Alicyclobacillus sp.]|nr:hypothetical protein [Alicyclobacillus sp.]